LLRHYFWADAGIIITAITMAMRKQCSLNKWADEIRHLPLFEK